MKVQIFELQRKQQTENMKKGLIIRFEQNLHPWPTNLTYKTRNDLFFYSLQV